MAQPVTNRITTPLRGGVDTYHEKILLPEGRFSSLKNLRGRHPGFEKRKGYILQHSIAGASRVASLFQFDKGAIEEKHLYRQLEDGSLEEASNNPPTVTVGAFGTQRLGTKSGTIPASYGVIRDLLLYSDGARQHQVYCGDDYPVSAFVVYRSATAIPSSGVIEGGEDYTNEVNDLDSTTEANLDALGSGHRFAVMSPVPIAILNLVVSSPNGNAVTISSKYWKGSWASIAGLSDGTASGGATLAQSGAVTWTKPTDELPSYLFGRSGFWYIFTTSAALDATVRVSQATFDSVFQDIVNVWDGALTEAIEAFVYDASELLYRNYGSNAITLNKMAANNDYCYFSTLDLISGFYSDIGATPNITKAVAVGASNINFVDGGTGDDYIYTTDYNFLSMGFEGGQTIVITGTVSNNYTTKIKSVTATTITLKTGTVTAEVNKSATITFGPNTTTISGMEVWTGSEWASVGTFVDGTSGLTESGFVTWDRTAITPQLTQFNNTLYYAYWYRFKVDATISQNVNIGITCIPYFNINDLGQGRCNAIWKERAVYTFNKYPQDVYISASANPLFLNGDDFGILQAGDGRKNPVLCMRKFYNELLVWQEESGVIGGCTTLFEGYSPKTFGKLLLSSRIGILNSKCAIVLDGILTKTQTEEKMRTLGFWLSREGFFTTDGRVIIDLSADIRNYFDPKFSECIRRGYESQHWIAYDSSEHVIRIGIVSGASATTPNIFLVYDLVDGVFSVDTGLDLSHFIEVEAASGQYPELQIGGGDSVYIMNSGLNDLSSAVDSEVVVELNARGRVIELKGGVIRCKAQTGSFDISYAINGNSTFGDSRTFSQAAQTAGDAYRRNAFNFYKAGHHLSVKLRNANVSESWYPTDMGLEILAIEHNV